MVGAASVWRAGASFFGSGDSWGKVELEGGHTFDEEFHRTYFRQLVLSDLSVSESARR